MAFLAPTSPLAERTDMRDLLGDALEILADLVKPGVPDPDLEDLVTRIRIALSEERVPEVRPFVSAGAALPKLERG